MWKDSETEIDFLNFGYLVDVVMGLITDEDITPSTIGIYGDWGSGKSSLMKMVEKKLEADKSKIIFVHFNGWLFEGYEDAKSALCGTILETIAKEQSLTKKVKEGAKKLLKKINYLKILGKGTQYGIDYFLTGGVASFVDIARHVTSSNEELGKILKSSEGIKREEIKSFQEDFARLIENSKVNHIIVFIDELDRCEPDTILDVFAAMRLFLFAKGMSFVIGADERLIQYAIKTKYKEVPGTNLDIGKEYLEKVVPYPVNIPQLSKEEVEQYISCLLLEKEIGKAEFEKILCALYALKPMDNFDYNYLEKMNVQLSDKSKKLLDLAHQISYALSSLTNGNPRQCKRFLNTLYMRIAMAKSRNVTLKLNVLAKLMLLEYYHPDTYELVLDSAKLSDLKEVEDGKDVRENNVFKESCKNDWFKSWLEIDIKISAENLSQYYYFSRKNNIIDQFSQSSLRPIAEKCYKDLKARSDISRQQGMLVTKQLSPNERIFILKLLNEDMNKGENMDVELFKSFISLGNSDDALRCETLKWLKAIPFEKYDVGIVGQMTQFINKLPDGQLEEFTSYLKKNKKIVKAVDAVTKIIRKE